MANKESIRRHLAEHGRFRVVSFFFGRLQCRLRFRPATFVVNANVSERYVFDVVSGYAADDRCVLWLCVIDDHVADDDPTQRANGRALRPAHSAAQSQEKRRIGNVSHGDV